MGTFGAGDRGRTGTVFPPRDFKSLASAYSATPAFQTSSYEREEEKKPAPWGKLKVKEIIDEEVNYAFWSFSALN